MFQEDGNFRNNDEISTKSILILILLLLLMDMHFLLLVSPSIQLLLLFLMSGLLIVENLIIWIRIKTYFLL
jgi:hypothetical protein